MKAYEDLLYERWLRQVESILPTLLKKNLLRSEAVKTNDEQSGTTDHANG